MYTPGIARSQGASSGPAEEAAATICEACRTTQEPGTADARSTDAGVYFCSDCLSAVSAIDFPEYYRDDGGGD